jgi:hypothetical protein
MRRFKWAVLLFSGILLLSYNIYAGDLMKDDGETLEDLGEGQYLSTSGEMMQVEDLGEGEAITTSGDLIVDEGGSGDYLMGSGETLRDTGSED